MDTTVVLGRPYQPRVIDTRLQRALATAGAVVVEGARACGKTMTSLHAAASYTFVDSPETQQLLSIAPRAVLEGESPRLLDEWQVAPELWNLVRRQIDASAGTGRFILTGSSVPADDVTRHTGAGRILRLRLRTMTSWEKSGSPAGGVSLASLFEGERPAASTDAMPDLDDVIDVVLRPGFPAMTELAAEQGAELLRAYAAEVARTDIQRLADVRHTPAVIGQLLASIARNVATEASYSTLAADVRSIAPDIRHDTVSGYVGLLRRLFVVELQPAWTPALRSRARLRTSPRFHLVDAALAAALLGAGAPRLRTDLETLGHVFESAVVHDLTVFAEALGGEVRHYRDSNGKEIDAVVALQDGRWAAVEVKLGGLQVQAGAESLAAVVGQVDTGVVGEPAFRLVVTGTGPVLTLADGTVTCPLAALAP